MTIREQVASVLIGLWILAGCAPSRETGIFMPPQSPAATLPTELRAAPFTTEEDAYRIRSGDQIDVKFPYRPDFNETIAVRPDGRVTLPLLASVMAAGMTPDELANELRNGYERLRTSIAPPGEREYLISAGDVVDVKFPVDTALNEQLTVRPDGRISLPLAGTLVAEGKTPEALQRELRQRLRNQTSNSDVTVIVRTMQSRQFRSNGKLMKAPISDLEEVYVVLRAFPQPRYYVGGEVLRPAEQPFTAPTSVLQSIFAAGGPTPAGELRSVVIMRRNAEGKPVIIVRDLQADIKGETHNDFPLKPFDVVYVPKTRIAEVQDFLNQYLYQIIPAFKNSSLGFSFIYDFVPR